MAYYVRRRTRQAQRAPEAKVRAPAFPAGKSYLESLPPELLIQIFITSQNTNFVFVSKAIYNQFGYKPSDGLLVEFCRFQDESKCVPGIVCLFLSGPSPTSPFPETCGLAKLLKLRGCSLHTFRLWAEKHEMGTYVEDGISGLVNVKKRWLKAENVDILTGMLNEGLLRFSISPNPERGKGEAKIKHAALLFLKPSVGVEWLMTLKSWYDPWRGRPRLGVFVKMFDADLLTVMSSKLKITFDAIGRVFNKGELQGNHRLQPLFGSRCVPIIRYLLVSGLAPTVEQLSSLSGFKMNEVTEMKQARDEKIALE